MNFLKLINFAGSRANTVNNAPKATGLSGFIQDHGKKVAFSMLAIIIMLIGLNVFFFMSKAETEKQLQALVEKNKITESQLAKLRTDYDELVINGQEKDAAFAEKELALQSKIKSLNQRLIKAQQNTSNVSSEEMEALKLQVEEANALVLAAEQEAIKAKSEAKDLNDKLAVQGDVVNETNRKNKELSDKNSELEKKMKGASALKAGVVTPNSIKTDKKGKPVPTKKVKDVTKIVVDYEIVPNENAPEGSTIVFMQIMDPAKKVKKTKKDQEELVVEGNTIDYTTSKTINYNKNNRKYTIDWANTEWVTGTYTVTLYTKDGIMGSGTFALSKK